MDFSSVFVSSPLAVSLFQRRERDNELRLESTAARIEFVSRKNPDFSPSFFDRRGDACSRGWRGILVCGRGGRIIECTLTRHPVSRLYSLPDNYNDNEASDDGRRWPAHTRPCSLLFILRSLPPILSPRLSALLSEFAGILLVGNFFIQHANLARRNIITPLCFNGAPLCLITTHRYESLEKRCVMYRVTTGHRRISERFSATGIVIRP